MTAVYGIYLECLSPDSHVDLMLSYVAYYRSQDKYRAILGQYLFRYGARLPMPAVLVLITDACGVGLDHRCLQLFLNPIVFCMIGQSVFPIKVIGRGGNC